MDVYGLLTNIMLQVLALTNGTLVNWVTLSGNSTSPLDSSNALNDCGSVLIQSIASLAIEASNILVAFFDTLF